MTHQSPAGQLSELRRLLESVDSAALTTADRLALLDRPASSGQRSRRAISFDVCAAETTRPSFCTSEPPTCSTAKDGMGETATRLRGHWCWPLTCLRCSTAARP